MQTITVGKLLQGKEGKKVWTIGPEASVYEALELMSAHDLGALVVTEQGRVVGLFSERDYARKVILRGKSSRTARVREMMSTPVLYATPDESVEDCLRVMTVKRIRHLPVLDGQQLVGIVSIGDAVERIIAEQKFEIGQLEKYIHGTGYN
ncbi:MAG: CBS domain-containing protein [Candidatus Eisenbacteria bacterium]|uniref:CBS domain-containing protein n=1 Tax=Eiseniibacteriota bacterium TaxID=2212470 RepID=A0A938BQI6_UNCEI|nr:CBS domain-containing protein [Candidatus Eisenbacteria bacterium]